MVLLLLPISVLLLKLFTSYFFKNETEKRVYMIVSFLIIVFFVGLRSVYSGSMDTLIYSKMFGVANSTPKFIDFLTIREIRLEDYWYQEGNFYLLVWLISRFTQSAQVFLVIITAIITACVFRFISQHSEDFMLSCIIYICLGSMTFSMNGMRQALAMSICLLAYGFAVKKKFVPFLLIVLFAMTFHVSAFIFLLVYPLGNFSKFHFVLLSIAGGLFIAFSSNLAVLYDKITDHDYALGESVEGGGYITVAIYLLVVMSVLMFRKKLEIDSKIYSLFALCFVGLIIYITRYFSTQIFERMSYYFYYFIILLIPKLSRLFHAGERQLFSLVVCILALALFAYRISSSIMMNYQFFFQG